MKTTLARLLILSALVTLLCTPHAQATGLTNFWSGDGDAIDSVGAANGTLVGGATYASGLDGQAFSFNGNGFIQAPSTTYSPNATNDFTIALWTKFYMVNGGPEGQLPNVFIGQDEGGGTTNKWIFFATSSEVGFHINGPAGGSSFLSAPFSFSANQWYNVAVTRSGNTFSFYVNGLLIGTAFDSQSIPNVNAPLTIAQAEGLGYFNGELENIAIYSGALTQSDISQMSNASCVHIDFTGFLSPVGGADATGGTSTDPIGAFKLGSTIPVKMQLTCSGIPVTAGVQSIQVKKFNSLTTSTTPIDATPTDSTTSGTAFRLTDPTTGSWQFNVSTKILSKGVWEILVTLFDGRVHTAFIELK